VGSWPYQEPITPTIQLKDFNIMSITGNTSAQRSGIDMARTFGSRFGITDQSNTGNGWQDMPKANVWLNIGVTTGDETYPFVSLPMGIPLDTMSELPVRGNAEFRQFTAARNDLLAQLKAAANALEPGSDMIIELDGGLAIQIRRVAEEQAAPAPEENRFAVNLGFRPAA
jgi:hypothetical protein